MFSYFFFCLKTDFLAKMGMALTVVHLNMPSAGSKNMKNQRYIRSYFRAPVTSLAAAI